MNSAESFELDSIRDGQRTVHDLVRELDRRIDLLVRKVAGTRAEEPVRTSQATPPPLPSQRERTASQAAAIVQQPPISSQPPPTVSEPKASVSPELPIERPTLPQLPAIEHPAEPAPSEPLELRVGTYWMARIGIVVLLTGLVFLGNYAYHRIVPLLGPWGKLSLLAVAGGALTFAGAWLERSREALRNYGRVLLSGGVAALYYTTYAAHYVAPLKVVENPLLGGTLLLAAAGGIMWLAERRRSEGVALLAILLSYYTSAINPVGAFTLFSNLLLTSAAVFFLVRHGWTKLSFAALFATYASYAFWRFHESMVIGATGSFGMGLAFLAGYWVLFTVAVFFAGREVLHSARRVAFLTLNNGALFLFGALHFAEHRPEEFWIFPLGLGGVLLLLAWFARRRHEADFAFDGAYLAQGIIAATIGIIARFTGPELSLILAVESAVLLTGIRLRHGLLCQIAAILCAVGAAGTALYRIEYPEGSTLVLGLSVGVVLLFDGWWVKYLRGQLAERLCTASAFAFSAFGLILIAATLWQETAAPWQPAVLAGLAVAGLAATRIRMLEIALLAQSFAALAVLAVCTRYADLPPSPWWNPLPVLVSSLLLMHWWQRASVEAFKGVSNAGQFVFAILAVAMSISWLHAFHREDAWLVATSVLGLSALGYGLLTRCWAIGVAGQFATVLACCGFAEELINGHPHWMAALSPVLSLLTIGFLLPWFAIRRWSLPVEPAVVGSIGQGYRWLASILFAAWAMEYVPVDRQVAFFLGCGAVQIAIGSLQHARARVIAGIAYAAVGVLLFWSRMGTAVHWLDLLAILALPGCLRWSERLAGASTLESGVRHSIVAAALVSLWIWVTRWMVQYGYAGQLTAGWAVLALLVFAAGLGLRDRVYRFGGFAILGVALLRLFVFDVWGFDTLYRIMSFLVLGAVLLILSFVYSRFAETFRKWL